MEAASITQALIALLPTNPEIPRNFGVFFCPKFPVWCEFGVSHIFAYRMPSSLVDASRNWSGFTASKTVVTGNQNRIIQTWKSTAAVPKRADFVHIYQKQGLEIDIYHNGRYNLTETEQKKQTTCKKQGKGTANQTFSDSFRRCSFIDNRTSIRPLQHFQVRFDASCRGTWCTCPHFRKDCKGQSNCFRFRSEHHAVTSNGEAFTTIRPHRVQRLSPRHFCMVRLHFEAKFHV